MRPRKLAVTGSSLEGIQDAFVHSPDHNRDNILSRNYDHVATGVVYSRGRCWVTVIFYG